MSEIDPPEPVSPKQDITQTVARKAMRKLRAQRTRQRSVLFGLGMFGLIGWSIAIPTLLGIALGIWMDKHFVAHISWTLTLMISGLFFGCLNAWRWVKKERPQNNDDSHRYN